MSSILKKQFSLQVSFKAFVGENPKEKQSNIICIPSYRKPSNDQEYEPLLLSNATNQLNIPVMNYSPEDQIQFIFRKISTKEFLGSISFTTDLFSAYNQKEFSQWATLFDDPEDDIFDGSLGEDDEDVPRAYLSFKISKVIKKKKEKKEIAIKIAEKTSEKKENASFNNISAVENDHDKNVSFANDDSDDDSDEDDENEKDDEGEIEDGKYKLEQQIETEELVKELRERLHSITSPEDLVKVTQEIEAKRANCESEIMKRVFKNRNLLDENGKIIEDSNKIIELEQEVSMYRLENEKVSKIESNTKEVKQMNTRLEKQYDDLLNKYKSCIESNEKECKHVVNENNGFKFEITSLKEQIFKLNNQINDLKRQTLEPKYQIEMDKLKVEKGKLKSNNMKKLVEDLTSQKNSISQALSQEKEENAKLRQKIEEINTLYKTNIEQTKDLEDEYEERTQQHAKDINNLNENLTESHNKILELENSLDDLKREHAITTEENEKLKAENQSLMENLRSLSKELKDAKISKFEEVSQLTNKINENQLELERLNNEIQHMKRELDFTNIQLKKQQDFDYPTQLRQKEALLHESEKQRNKLQDDLSLAHRQYKQNMEDMTKKIIESNEAMSNITTEDEYSNSGKPITIATLREIEERYRQELLEREKKINDLVYIVKTYKINEQMLAERDKIIEELRKQIAELKETIRKLQEERDKLQAEIFRLTEELIKQSKTNLDQTHALNKLAEDNKRLQQNLDSAIECVPRPKQSSKYIPAKGDKIDKRLSIFINKTNSLPIQFIRIGEGLYTFGTKKIAVKILNGKIVIRVGGGYLMIEEFLRLYTFSELKKLGEIAKTGKNPVPEQPKKVESSDSDSDSDSSEPEVDNMKPSDIKETPSKETVNPPLKNTMLSPREANSMPSDGKKGTKKTKKTGEKKTSKQTQKRFTLYKPGDEDQTKKKGNDVTLEVTKAGSGVKYEKQNTTAPNFHSPRNFQSPPPSKRVVPKK